MVASGMRRLAVLRPHPTAAAMVSARQQSLKAVLTVRNDLAGNIALNRVLPALAERGHAVHVLLGDSPAPASAPAALRRQVEMERDMVVDGLFPALEARGPVVGEPTGLLTFNQLTHKYDVPMQVVKGGINRGTKKGGANFDLLASLEADFLLSIRFPFVFKQPVLELPKMGVFNIHPGALPGYAGLQCPFQAMRLGESGIGATLHGIDTEGIDSGPVLSIDYTPINLQRSVMWHTTQVYPKGVDSFLHRALPHLEAGRPEDIQARPQPAGEHPYFSNPSDEVVQEGLDMGIQFSNQADFDELAGLYHSSIVVGRATAAATGRPTSPSRAASPSTAGVRKAAAPKATVSARAVHSSASVAAPAVQAVQAVDAVDATPKAYVLGGFGGAAGLDIASKLFWAGRNVHGGSEHMADSGDVHFVLDSHPGKEGHVTTEGCVAPLQAGLDRAAAHREALGGGPLVVAIGCNTMHTALPLVQMPDGVHVVHIMAATARELRRAMSQPAGAQAPRPRRAVLWSTLATAASGMYQKYCKSVAGKVLETPEAAHADAIEQVIELTKIGKVGEAVGLLKPILASYAPGTLVVLGCTELPLLMDAVADASAHVRFVDCNGALARDTVATYATFLDSQGETREAFRATA